jgi:hypothetical protein
MNLFHTSVTTVQTLTSKHGDTCSQFDHLDLVWHVIFLYQEAVTYHMTSSMHSKGACLDNNHSHFILVDNGTVDQYGVEISFRANLENCISRKTIAESCGKFILTHSPFVFYTGFFFNSSFTSWSIFCHWSVHCMMVTWTPCIERSCLLCRYKIKFKFKFKFKI